MIESSDKKDAEVLAEGKVRLAGVVVKKMNSSLFVVVLDVAVVDQDSIGHSTSVRHHGTKTLKQSKIGQMGEPTRAFPSWNSAIRA